MSSRWRRRRDLRDDRGSYTLFGIAMAFVLLLLVGMVYDLGAQLRAGREAASLAEETARAGAGQIDRDRAYTGGRLVIDRTEAIRTATAYLHSSGRPGTVSVDGTRRIRATVTVSKPTALLSIIGIDSVQVTRTATADLLTGVEGPGQ